MSIMIEILGLILGAIGTISGLFALYLHYLNYKRFQKTEHSKKIIKEIKSWLETLNILYSDFSLKLELPQKPHLEFIQSHLKSGYKEDWNLLNEIIDESLTLSMEYENLVGEIEKTFQDFIKTKKLDIEFNLKNVVFVLFRIILYNRDRTFNLTFKKEEIENNHYLTIIEFSGTPNLIKSNEEKDLDTVISFIKEIKNSERFKEIVKKITGQMENIRRKLNEFSENLWNKIDLSGKFLKGKCKLC